MQLISRTSRRCTRALAHAAAISLVAAACASSPPSSSGGTPGPRTGPNFITADEISRVNVQNAYEAVQKLRPSMLRQRQVASANGQGGVGKDAPAVTGTSVSAGQLVVYVDNTRLGDVDQLRGIAASSIFSVRYFSASEAQTKWGSGHPGGAIEVITKR